MKVVEGEHLRLVVLLKVSGAGEMRLGLRLGIAAAEHWCVPHGPHRLGSWQWPHQEACLASADGASQPVFWHIRGP